MGYENDEEEVKFLFEKHASFEACQIYFLLMVNILIHLSSKASSVSAGLSFATGPIRANLLPLLGPYGIGLSFNISATSPVTLHSQLARPWVPSFSIGHVHHNTQIVVGRVDSG